MNIEDQLRAALTRQADRYEVPLPDIDGFAAGAVRRGRRDRLVAAVAACAVLAIVASGFVAGRAWWGTRGAGPADQPTSPTPESTTSSSPDDLVGIIGPPPSGTPPTGPATGELVAAATFYLSGTWVYADGRIISVRRNSTSGVHFRGYVVRQLTPSGVEAMRSFLLEGTSGLIPVSDELFGTLIVRDDGGRLRSARYFDGCEKQSGSRRAGAVHFAGGCAAFTNPEDWLPPGSWEDPTFRPFIPHTYEICTDGSAMLPAEAADIYRASPVRDGDADDCRAVATSDARALVDALEEAGAASSGEPDLPNLQVDLRSLGGGGLHIAPILPHGGPIFCNCG